ncbi:MAG TPA: hypothetical protein VF188_07355 [Longimicrobiales bacterium]
MATLNEGDPVWIEYEPARHARDGGYHGGTGSSGNQGGRVWVPSADGRPVDIGHLVRRWRVSRDEIEIETSQGTARAKPDVESDPSRGLVRGRVTAPATI